MDHSQTATLIKLRLSITIVVSMLILGWLLWVHFHGGVPSHHLLDNKDLPAISNWWSGVLLPVLTWILLGKVKTRMEKQDSLTSQNKSGLIPVLGLFSLGLVFGIILSISFTYNFKPFLDNVLYLLLILSFIVPLFYSEFILGFVLGMTYTFGSILPTIFILIIAAIGFLIYRFIRPFLMKLTKISRK